MIYAKEVFDRMLSRLHRQVGQLKRYRKKEVAEKEQKQT